MGYVLDTKGKVGAYRYSNNLCKLRKEGILYI